MQLSVFVADTAIRVHGSHCSCVVKDWRKYGNAVVILAESRLGVVKAARQLGIRVDGIKVMPCAPLAEGFWSYTPEGEKLRLLPTERGSKIATSRIRREERKRDEALLNEVNAFISSRTHKTVIFKFGV